MAYDFQNQTVATTKIMASGSFFSYPLTINCWFNAQVTGAGAMDMVQMTEDTATNSWHSLRINTSTNILSYNTGTPVGANATASYTASTWNMATAVGTSTTSRTVYLNAANSATQTTTRSITTPNRVCIGMTRSTGSDSPTYDGYLAEVAVWNVALSTAELASLYTGTKANQIRPQNLKFYMPLVRNLYDATASTTGITYDFAGQDPVVNHVRRYG